MIRGIHGLFYSSDPDATRDFFRDQVKLPGGDIGGGWWIFDFAEGDLGVHPVDEGGKSGGHDISFYCDDIEGTVADMKARGVEFTAPIADHGYGLVTYFTAPGGITVQLYEPRYTKSKAQAVVARARKAAAGAQTKVAAAARQAVEAVTAAAQRASGGSKKSAGKKAAAKSGGAKTKPSARGALASVGAKKRGPAKKTAGATSAPAKKAAGGAKKSAPARKAPRAKKA